MATWDDISHALERTLRGVDASDHERAVLAVYEAVASVGVRVMLEGVIHHSGGFWRVERWMFGDAGWNPPVRPLLPRVLH